MDRARNHLLATAGLAEQQHRRVSVRHLRDPLHHVAQAGVGADNRVCDVGPAETVEQRAPVRLGHLAQRRCVALPCEVPKRRGKRLDQREHDVARGRGKHGCVQASKQ